MHTTKVKDKDKITGASQRALGSVAWKAFADTMIVIEPYDIGNIENAARMVHVLPKNHPPKRLDYKMNDDGIMEEIPSLDPKELNLLMALPCSTELTRKSLVEAGDKLGMSRATVDRMLKSMLCSGKLVRSDTHGCFIRPVSNAMKAGVAGSIKAPAYLQISDQTDHETPGPVSSSTGHIDG